ncbi:MAG: alpha/beta hydrolase [Betaproteobacteria bacterium]|nr:alpha/beta hydrolase [Betaproteobacteria bacterium]
MQPRILFSHGNSFPGGTYRVLLENLRQRGFEVQAIDKFGHEPDYPVTNNWPHLVQQLADTARRWQNDSTPAYLVGHSLGGILSLMCAARHPELARGVLLLDSPILGGWKATTLGLAKKTQLVGALSPGRISRKRRDHWANRAEVLEHLRHKRAFAHWDPQVLADYVDVGTHEQDGQRWLSFDRDIETAIYNTLPHNLTGLLKRHPLKCPVAFIGGTHSVEMHTAGMEMTDRVARGRVMMLDGSHLFPMEKPLATAAAIEASLRNLPG